MGIVVPDPVHLPRKYYLSVVRVHFNLREECAQFVGRETWSRWSSIHPESKAVCDPLALSLAGFNVQ